jgi:hypothetical protein
MALQISPVSTYVSTRVKAPIFVLDNVASPQSHHLHIGCGRPSILDSGIIHRVFYMLSSSPPLLLSYPNMHTFPVHFR